MNNHLRIPMEVDWSKLMMNEKQWINRSCNLLISECVVESFDQRERWDRIVDKTTQKMYIQTLRHFAWPKNFRPTNLGRLKKFLTKVNHSLANMEFKHEQVWLRDNAE